MHCLFVYASCYYVNTINELFVRDGILSVADYNSTLMGVVVVVVMSDFTMG